MTLSFARSSRPIPVTKDLFMNQRLLLLLTAIAALSANGCMSQPNGPLLGNINGTRIASPGTGTIQYPRMANLPDPYYGNATLPPGVSPTINTSQGWRPAGTPASTPLTGSPAPTSFNVPNLGPTGQIPQNNMSVASSTSLLQPGGNLQVAQSTTGILTNNTGVANTMIAGSGSMPLNDATNLNGPNQPNQFAGTGQPRQAMEYVVRPTSVPGNVYNGGYPGMQSPQPYNGPVVYNGVPQNYTNAPYQGNYPYGYQQGVIADGWRQRDTR
jgi:hypothetical protein